MDNLIYLYGIVPENEISAAPLPSFKGLDNEHAAYTISINGINAVVCNLDEAGYKETELEKKTNDPQWLHEKAFHHHEVLLDLNNRYTVIPMKFCTIYENADSLWNKLEPLEQKIAEQLKWLKNKEEWNMKIYCDDEKLRESVAAHNLTIEAKKKEIEEMSPGRQFLEKKRLDQLIDQEALKEKETFSARVHEQLTEMCEDTSVKKNWNKKVTGRNDEMCWNSVYLLSTENVEEYLSEIKSLQDKWTRDGWHLEITGPWPAYHFASLT
ncbi:GvpL/GvpF family gas vesicle protein [Thalassobacillus pellis]|uniref:GvpL/GvpF family gas vesicle protein n=1 Tax=Thalassobacillus pellis TaxID=748008 RepID=UPI00195FB1D4|nr:GvpL/GvpF family gas vesicle protein [Thalassobacillus pellis]MBM7551298.1 hypothetical protein [Thalassobacillus pellis]